MKQYLELMQHIIDNGHKKTDRTGTGTLSVFGHQMRFDLAKGFPLVTTKKVHLKSVIHELLWFIKGDTNVKYLNDNGVTIWNEWRRPYNLDRNFVLIEKKESSYTEYKGDFSYRGLNAERGSVDSALAATWFRMMKRCYDPSCHNYSMYGARGVSVHPDWHDPIDFVKQVKKIPHWFYKNNFPSFELDKDYFGSNQYGPDTCVWLRTDENNLYTKTANPVLVRDREGVSRIYLSQAEAARRIGMPASTMSRIIKDGFPSILKGSNKEFTGWELRDVDFEGKLPRLELIQDGELGPVYGSQWRAWKTSDGREIDQLKQVISSIKNNQDSRRHVVSAWNLGELNRMALPPCHVMFQFYVADGKLSCQLYQRSTDVFLGLPFNIASYSLLTMMIAHVCQLGLGEFIWTGGDCHLYLNHLDQAREQLSREPQKLPWIGILNDRKHINEFVFDDFGIHGYKCHPAIPAPIAV